MLKFCIHCGKEFEGSGDVCQECQTVTIAEKPSPVGTLLTKIKEKASPKTIIICAASLVGLIAIIIVISIIAANSQSAYNKYAEHIFEAVTQSDDRGKVSGNGAVAFDSDGNVIYGANISHIFITDDEWYGKSPEEIENADEKEIITSNTNKDYLSQITQKYSKATELKWIVVFDETGNVEVVYCSDSFDSGKIGRYSNSGDGYNIQSIKTYERSQHEVESQEIQKHRKELAESVKKVYNAAKIYSHIVQKYRPDGIDKTAVYSNFKGQENEITREISTLVDGYWSFHYEISSSDEDKTGTCWAYWSSNKTDKPVAYCFNDSGGKGFVNETLEETISKREPQCGLISCESWDKKCSQEYDDVREVAKHSFGTKDAFVSRFNSKLSSLMGTELQFKSQANKENNSIRYDYTYLNGAVTLTILEKHGYIVMANTSTNVSLSAALGANNTQLWTGIVNSCYFPLAVFENYSDKDEVIKTFLANYIDTNDVITINGSSYSATLYNTSDGTLVSFLPN